MHTRAPRPVTACAKETATTAASLARYWFGIVPLVRRELRHWGRRAQAIPDPALREQAVATLDAERLNAEAAAVFATLASRAQRPTLVPLLVAFQVMYDFLDTVSEEPVADPLGNGRQLHRALAAALDPDLAPGDFYALHPRGDDGGYLDALVQRCRSVLADLPAAAIVLPLARRAAERCSAGQSHTHAAMRSGDAALAAWALAQDRADGLLWWELAAGAISSVGVFALLAAAADARTTGEEASRIDAAYFPAICALSTLLDSLIDRDDDEITANHSSFAQYATAELAAQRIGCIARSAKASARRLRHGPRHVAIVSGIAAYYLSAADLDTPEARLVSLELRESLGLPVRSILATMRVRRWLRTRAGPTSLPRDGAR